MKEENDKPLFVSQSEGRTQKLYLAEFEELAASEYQC
jgi:hypothetical protein